jgi:hypothetical protein
MATQWLEADYDTLRRLAYMVDAEARGEGGTVLRREIRLLEDAFGLNPAARARLRWQIGDDAKPEARASRPNVRRLRAVDPEP